MSHTHPAIVDQPGSKLKAIRRSGPGVDRSDVGEGPSSKIHIHELVGEAYTVLSLVGIIGVLIYHIVG
ncbi:MAG TPA: hypothetical protein VG125_24945 [Pirellulales bacterium]|jgi:hypothetical protein|nr:hypothetical protein [Pirellulales bacterium]